ncbi:mercury resistance system transport protein MerF [Marinobacter mobilis]|uniref:Mercuric ion transport protein n=1 Tax=Marinobacter mobilis TaxID=488533 RepID=A0A1H2WL80_9GAMM|nr:mercury resistance system transport protein MerF [Marinobacter mobilis]SDW81024.1 mercuric ion transport protein [Marinobacter mobilis]
MNKLTKTGLIGSVVTALCCFTPVLVWLFAALGLSAMVGYLDVVLFPMLGVFVLLLLIGIVKSARENKE